jgi:ABC-type Zn uptake system ZnuABC Zn-binding protein ZnuA
MKKGFIIALVFTFVSGIILPACKSNVPNPNRSNSPAGIKVLAAESFIADIARNVAGDRLQIDTLIPLGVDPHEFEPIPQDVVNISDSDILIINGAGFEGWLQKVIDNAGGTHLVIEASKGLRSRTAREGEVAVQIPDSANVGQSRTQSDPHFWLDPINVIKYVENIRDGFIQSDPAGQDLYSKNAETYIAKLKDLDQYIQEQVKIIPVEKRLIVTNHESFGYFADRYQFKIIGTIIPSISSGASPSAQQLAGLIDNIKSTKAIALFLETGTNPQLANQISKETGIKIITDLYTHSITAKDGPAPTYIAMMTHNIDSIINALK